MISERLAGIASKVVEDKEYSLTTDEISELIQVSQENIIDLIDLMKEANRINNRYKGKRVHICSIINARCGFCSEDCAFCAQSVCHNTNIRAYSMLDADEIAQKAVQLYKAGARFFSFVTSGYMITEDDVETICKAARIIKQETALTLCASLGVLTLPIGKYGKPG